jgi:hypothetical protein
LFSPKPLCCEFARTGRGGLAKLSQDLAKLFPLPCCGLLSTQKLTGTNVGAVVPSSSFSHEVVWIGARQDGLVELANHLNLSCLLKTPRQALLGISDAIMSSCHQTIRAWRLTREAFYTRYRK